MLNLFKVNPLISGLIQMKGYFSLQKSLSFCCLKIESEIMKNRKKNKILHLPLIKLKTKNYNCSD